LIFPKCFGNGWFSETKDGWIPTGLIRVELKGGGKENIPVLQDVKNVKEKI